MSRFTFGVTGQKEIEKLFIALPSKIRNQCLRPTIRAASKLVLEEAKRRAPESPGIDGEPDTGDMKKTMRIRSVSRAKRGSIMYVIEAPPIVTVTDKKGKTKTRAKRVKDRGTKMAGQRWYSGFVERGTKSMRAQPFMRPAADAMRDSTENMVRTAVRKFVEALRAEGKIK